jgi:hypothetical protein
MPFSATFLALHPNLETEGFRETSDSDEDYNCVAWALGRQDVWFEADRPGCFWPENVPGTGP